MDGCSSLSTNLVIYNKLNFLSSHDNDLFCYWIFEQLGVYLVSQCSFCKITVAQCDFDKSTMIPTQTHIIRSKVTEHTSKMKLKFPAPHKPLLCNMSQARKMRIQTSN